MNAPSRWRQRTWRTGRFLAVVALILVALIYLGVSLFTADQLTRPGYLSSVSQLSTTAPKNRNYSGTRAARVPRISFAVVTICPVCREACSAA